MSHYLKAIETIDRGSVIEQADEQLKQVIEAVHASGKEGSVTVKLKIKPNGDRGYAVTADLTAKAPQLAFGQSFFYADRNGELTRTPPVEEARTMLRMTEEDQA